MAVVPDTALWALTYYSTQTQTLGPWLSSINRNDIEKVRLGKKNTPALEKREDGRGLTSA